MGLELLGSSSREASKISLFSMVLAGGLLGRGPEAAPRSDAAGTRGGGAGDRTGAGLGTAGRAGMIAEVEANGGAGAAAPRTSSGALGIGRFVPGGGAGALVGMIW